MEWDKKVEMAKLQNNQAGLMEFAVKNHKEFDGQAWDMFAECIFISVEEFKEHEDAWKQMWPEVKNIDCNDEKFGFRTGMRIAMIQTICEDELKLN
jgi:hypothetical protein